MPFCHPDLAAKEHKERKKKNEFALALHFKSLCSLRSFVANEFAIPDVSKNRGLSI
jgi:hypothetical protein